MGQGSDSCGGYEVDFDPYEEGMAEGVWTTKSGEEIHISQMTISHLRGARRVAYRAQMSANFTNTAEMWEHWVEMLDDEISRRPQDSLKAITAPKAPPRGKMAVMICHCKREYKAREADLKRGSGFSCSKSCAAIRREYGRPKATRKV